MLYDLWVYSSYIVKTSAFRQASDQRGDDLAERLADDATAFWCHKNCISMYWSPDHIQRFLTRIKESDSDNPDSSGSSSKHSSVTVL